MLPVVKGEAATRRQILAYTLDPRRVHPAAGRHRLPRAPLPGLRRDRSAPASSSSPLRLLRARRARRRCASTSPRSPTWRCCSARWPWTGSSDTNDPRMDRTRATATLGSGLLAGRDRARRLRARLLHRDRLHRLSDGRRAPQRSSRSSSSTCPGLVAAGADRVRPRRGARLAVHLVALRRDRRRRRAVRALRLDPRRRAGYSRLPRRQRIATAVLPAVPLQRTDDE